MLEFDEIYTITTIPSVNGRKLALIEADEYSFVERSLNRWVDRSYPDRLLLDLR